jgi:MFS family permease
LFWLLQDLGGSKSLMGLTITVGGLIGIPLLVLSGPIIKKLGHANVIFIGFAFYAIRLIGYSLIYNPWLCLIFEAMESVTFGLSFTAAVTYAARLSTVTTDTTIQGLLGGLYFAVGQLNGFQMVTG